VNVDQTTPEKMQACLEEKGIAFLFAPLLHGAMKIRRTDPARTWIPDDLQSTRSANESGRCITAADRRL